jgi:transcriptional regulator with XRE-family HTH domain
MSAPYPNHIREWREFRHMTQDELADAVGCSKASIGHWENGVREVAPKWLYPIAKVLNTSPGYLLDHDPNNLPTAVLDIWADIPSEDQPKALEMLRVFKRTGTTG